MSKFVDKDGNEWELVVTVGDLARVKAGTGIDLARCMRDEDAFMELLFGDPLHIAGAIWLLVEQQADQSDISQEHFYCSLDAAALERAVEALLAAAAAFMPRTKIGSTLVKNLRGLLDTMDEAMLEHMDAVAPVKPKAIRRRKEGAS